MANIEDSIPDPGRSGNGKSPHEKYNIDRRARGKREFTLDEYNRRCELMVAYKDGATQHDRDEARRQLRAMDSDDRFGDGTPEIPMPIHIREGLRKLTQPSGGR